MNFRKARNITEWNSHEGYNIRFRDTVYGVAVAPRYIATVLVRLPGGREMRDLVDPAKPQYRTQKAAEAACARHYKKWTKLARCKTKTELLELVSHVPQGAPAWVALETKIRKLVGL